MFPYYCFMNAIRHRKQLSCQRLIWKRLSDTIWTELSTISIFRTVSKKKQNVHGYDNIQFHLILFPVPNKNEIVNWFVERAKQIKEDA